MSILDNIVAELIAEEGIDITEHNMTSCTDCWFSINNTAE